MSTERLDRSAESFDLKRAVWAGFLESRFWRIAARIELHAVVGTIILLATLSLLWLDLGMLYLQHRLPNDTTMNVFLATIGPLGFWYVVHQNMGFLRWVWENPWGKLAYGLLASVTVTGCKVIADQQIRLLTQSDPSLFPSAQQAITVLNIIAMIFAEIGLLMLLGVLIQLGKQYVEGIIDWVFLQLNVLFHIRELLGFPSQRWTFRSFASSLTRLFAPNGARSRNARRSPTAR